MTQRNRNYFTKRTHYPNPKCLIDQENTADAFTEICMPLTDLFNGSFPKWSRPFIEFSKFRESDKSLGHEL